MPLNTKVAISFGLEGKKVHPSWYGTTVKVSCPIVAITRLIEYLSAPAIEYHKAIIGKLICTAKLNQIIIAVAIGGENIWEVARARRI